MKNLLVASLLVLAAACTQQIQPPTSPASVIAAVAETAAVNQEGDAADDPAIWVAPNPTQSLVIATQKKGGLYVFDLSGAIVQEAPGGEPNNVDIREGFAWTEGAAPIVGASDRTDNALVFWRFDPTTRRLDPTVRSRIPTGFAEVYGFCLGRMGEDFVAIATDKDSGEVGVWRLSLGADGMITGERIVTHTLGSIAEGCVVDDDAGVYYVAQELVGIWRADLDDATGANRRQIGAVGDGNLVEDVEGLTLWRDANGGGYLIASVQGASRYAVYNRDDNAYRGAFEIGASADGSADAVQGTDGIDIVSAPLGPDYPAGLFVAQDDENTNPAALQNFKYASWADVMAALNLE